jgi:hypothetical protein
VTALAFDVVDARPEPYAAVPTITFTMQVAETSGADIHTILLRTQIQIEPRKRRYSHDEQSRLYELFGEPSRWDTTLRTVLWGHVTAVVNNFKGSTSVELSMPCTYDLEVASTKYFHALDDGLVHLVFLFSGTVFVKGENGAVQINQVPWCKEATYALPAQTWKDVMDAHFPGQAWLRVRRETLDALQRYKSERAIPSWDTTFERLLREAGADGRAGSEGDA